MLRNMAKPSISSAIQRLLRFLCKAVEDWDKSGTPFITKRGVVSIFVERLGDFDRFRDERLKRMKGWFADRSLVPNQLDRSLMFIDGPLTRDQYVRQPIRSLQRTAPRDLATPYVPTKGLQPIGGQEIRNRWNNDEISQAYA